MFYLQEYVMREAFIISILYFVLNVMYNVDTFFKIIYYMYVISIVFKNISLYGERNNDLDMEDLYSKFHSYINLTVYIMIYIYILYSISVELTLYTDNLYDEI